MTDLKDALERHRPVLRYDKQEVYFADSAAIFTDGPAQELSTADGAVLAAARPSGGEAKLKLSFLTPDDYATGRKVSRQDRIGCATTDYSQQARRLHNNNLYRNRMYGRGATGRDGRVWLQYWFFYFYNDYNLLGPLVPAGLHEGDWEMVQLRLDMADETPDLAVYAQHKHADSRPWAKVKREGERPVVYAARGSHAAYFTSGTHWTGVWFDHADGDGFAPDVALEVVRDDDVDYEWLQWPGFWGDTQPSGPLDSSSPTSPSRHPQWNDPSALLEAADDHARALVAGPPRPKPPPAPRIEGLGRDGEALRIEYATSSWPKGAQPAQLIVALNSPDDPLPPRPLRAEISAKSGVVEIPAGLRDDWRYDVTVSVADRRGLASASRRETLARG